MRLYHYTSLFHVPSIFADGCLKTFDSGVGSANPAWPPCGKGIAPDVVFLTSQTRGIGHGLRMSQLDKTRVRFCVDVPAERFFDFANRHGINKKWRQQLDRNSEFTQKYEWVLERPIVQSEWLEILDMGTCRPLADEDIPSPFVAAMNRFKEGLEIMRTYEAYLRRIGASAEMIGDVIARRTQAEAEMEKFLDA